MKIIWNATTAVGGGWTQSEGEAAFRPDTEEVENQVVNLYPEVTFQTFEGFGGAITDAAGYVYSLMNEAQKRQVVETYFSPEGIGYDRVRVHMDSCDFSRSMYEAMSDPDDRELSSFSFARTEKYILPMLADAQKAAGKPLKLMLSPWSPPAFMKTNGSRVQGGRLKPEYPDLKLITSESCIEYRFHASDAVFDNAAKLAHELLGDLNHGMNAFYDWNLLLDETGGPNHVGNLCHAPFMYDTKEKTLRPQLLQQYYWHFSHYIVPGAKRIALSKYTHALEVTAFQNPDGTVVLVLFNAGSEQRAVKLRLDGKLAELTLGGQTIVSCTLRQ